MTSMNTNMEGHLDEQVYLNEDNFMTLKNSE
jgi:hypothetical protein